MYNLCTDMLDTELVIVTLSIAMGRFSQYILATYDNNRYVAELLQPPLQRGSEYGFIVLGSGTSGSVVASHSADPNYQGVLTQSPPICKQTCCRPNS